MKIRNDFVTNSSSSSFVIATKDEINKEMLLNCFRIPEKSPLFDFANDLSNFIVGEVKKHTIEEIIDDYCCDSINELPSYYQKAINKGFNNLYRGSASNESDGIEMVFCDMSMEYEDENIIIIKDGGY